LNCYYSRDDEGNGYQEVYCEASFGFIDGDEFIDEEYVKDENIDISDLEQICCIN